MQWGKVKNILIVILAAINLFLLVNLGAKFWQDWKRESEIRGNLALLLEDCGISLSSAFDLPGDTVLPVLSVDRSRTSEETASAAALGGGTDRTEREDGTVLLQSEAGLLEWQADGRLHGSVLLAGESVPSSASEAEESARGLLSAWGLAPEDAVYTASDDLSVTMTGTQAGLPVFNRFITLSFQDNGEVEISGQWSFGTPYTTAQAGGTSCAAADALLSFAAAEEQSCTRIDSMTLGYRLQADSSRRLQLAPTWKIQTDAGEYLVDCAKKTILPQEN